MSRTGHEDVMPAPLVSVVIPVYNGERFVVEAVRSILSQTFRDFECIVVDDGSSDRTAGLLAAEQAADSRLIVHRHPTNLGFKNALNTGCALARGEFIARMDADDVSLPQRLEQQLAFLRRNPRVGVVGSAVQVIDDAGVRGRTKSFPAGSGVAAWSMLFFNSLAHPAVMVRRALLESVGFFPSGCAGGTEDYAVFLEISRKARLANLPDVLLLYRIWGGSMTHVKWEAQERDAVRLLRQFLTATYGVEVSVEAALALRGLSRDQYPSDPADADRVAALIERLATLYAAEFSDDQSDVRAIRADAGVRLWLLSALAARKSPRVGASIAWRASRMSPRALPAFLAKVSRRLTARS